MANTLDRVGVHADALEKIADNMKADGVGLHMSRGHVAILKGMASAMRVDKAQGRVPSEFSPGYYAAADKLTAAAAVMNTAVAESMGGLNDAGLPPHINRLLTQHGVALPSGQIAAADLQTKMEAAGMGPGDRIVVKHAMLALGRIGA